jgi:hypothetical protein
VNQTLVDVRNWTLADVATHPDLVQRLIATDHADALGHVTKAANAQDLVTQLDDAVKNPQKYPAPAATQPVAQTTTPAVVKR